MNVSSDCGTFVKTNGIMPASDPSSEKTKYCLLTELLELLNPRRVRWRLKFEFARVATRNLVPFYLQVGIIDADLMPNSQERSI